MKKKTTHRREEERYVWKIDCENCAEVWPILEIGQSRRK